MKTYKQITNIYWRKEALYVKLTHEDYAKMYTHFKENGFGTNEKLKRSAYKKNNSFRLDERNNILYIYCRFQNELVVFYTNKLDNTKNVIGSNSGPKAIQAFQDKFKELNNDITFKKAFGYVDEDIIGLNVYNEDKLIGVVDNIMKNKQEILVIKDNNKSYLVPFVDEFVINIDLDSKRMDIKVIEGLLNDN